jgi:hypothetical protein
MAIDGCAFFYGSIVLKNCLGMNITSGLIGCSIDTTESPLPNRIAGNYVIEGKSLKRTFKFSPATIVQDNFGLNLPVKPGSWRHNTARR